jgi:hypothetical protein
MKCPKCETQLEVAPAAYPGEHTASVCRDILAERLSEVNAARRGAEAKADEWMARTKAMIEQLQVERAAWVKQIDIERARSAALEAVIREMGDLIEELRKWPCQYIGRCNSSRCVGCSVRVALAKMRRT